MKTIKPNIYQNTAQFYDIGNSRTKEAVDIVFYKSLLAPKETVLEIGCGTGRVAIELAKAGHPVEGLELSESMLNILKEKIKKETNIDLTLTSGDMREFSLNKTFDWIIFPFRVFQALENNSDRKSCLDSLRKHMTIKSKAVICMFNPHPDMLRNWGSKGIVDFDFPLPDSSMNVRQISDQVRHDLINQTIEVDMFIEKHKDGQIVERIPDKIVLGYLYSAQAKALFETSGFEIEEEYAGYDKSNVTDGVYKELIYILKLMK